MTKANPNIAELERAARAANHALHKAEEAEREKQNRLLVGCTFKYRNSYSCPEKPSDYWWLYAKVAALTGGQLILFTFQTDSRGSITIKTKEYCWPSLTSGYRKIPAVEFYKAWRALQKKIAGLQP